MFDSGGLARAHAALSAVLVTTAICAAAACTANGGAGSGVGGAVSSQVIGAVELVLLVEQEMALPARIDTGATTCSLDARNLKEFERDGKPWVTFDVVDRERDQTVQVKRRLVRKTTIKRHGAPDSVRPVVRMEIVLGDVHTEVEFTLTDRSNFEFPILVGRNLLEGRFVVDVARENSAPPRGSGD